MLRSLRDCFNHYDQKIQGFLKSSKALTGFIKNRKKLAIKRMQAEEKLRGREQVTKLNNPRLYMLFEDVYKKLNRYANNTLKRPKLYIAYDYYSGENANASAYIDGNITITFDAANLPDEMAKSIIAHEFGHIIFNHSDFLPLFNYVFENMDDPDQMLDRADTILGHAKASNGDDPESTEEEAAHFIFQLKLWQRSAELTADNVACLYSGSSDPLIDCEMHFYNNYAKRPFKKRKDFIGFCYLQIVALGHEYYEKEYYDLESSHPHYVFRVRNAYENMGGKPFLTKEGKTVLKQAAATDTPEKKSKDKPRKQEPVDKRKVTFIYRYKNSSAFQRKKALFIIINDVQYRLEPDHSITFKLDATVDHCTIFVEGDNTKYSCEITSSEINIEYDVSYGAPIVLA